MLIKQCCKVLKTKEDKAVIEVPVGNVFNGTLNHLVMLNWLICIIK